MRRHAPVTLLALALLAGDGAAQERDAPTGALPPAVQQADLEEHLGRTVDHSLRFTDSEGREVPLSRYLGDGKPVVLVLAYFRCPTLCGLVLRGAVEGMKGLDWPLGERYRALTVSFDPRDDPGAARQKQDVTLAGFAEPVARDAWPFLVGTEPASRALADDLGFRYAYDARSDQYAHPAAIFVLTPEGRISRYLYGARYSALDLRLALLEASEGKIGTLADRVIMTCFRYDPATRVYGPYLFGFLRIGGALIGITVLTVLGLLVRADRRRRAGGPAT